MYLVMSPWPSLTLCFYECRFLFKGNEEFKQKVIETRVPCPSISSERVTLESGSGSRSHATLPSLSSTIGTDRDSGISRSHEYKERRSLNSSLPGEYNFLPFEVIKRRISNETASPSSNGSQMHSEPVHDHSCSPSFPFAFEPAGLLDDGGQYIKMNGIGLPPEDYEEDTVGYEPVGPTAFSPQPTTTLHQQTASQRLTGSCCPQTQEQLLKEMQDLDLYDNFRLRTCPGNRPSYENVIRHD